MSNISIVPTIPLMISVIFFTALCFLMGELILRNISIELSFKPKQVVQLRRYCLTSKPQWGKKLIIHMVINIKQQFNIMNRKCYIINRHYQSLIVMSNDCNIIKHRCWIGWLTRHCAKHIIIIRSAATML